MTKANSLQVVLFDLGGILLRLRDPAATFGLATSVEEFNRKWLMSASVRDFERGRMNAAEFGRRAVAELGLSCDGEEFLRRFDRWPEALYPGAIKLLRSIPAHYACAVLSNTNALHWGRSDIGQQLEVEVDRVFLSFETGVVKPDQRAFRQVTEHYGCSPNEVFFLDDNSLNTDAAAAFGMQAKHCRGIENVRNALSAAKIV